MKTRIVDFLLWTRILKNIHTVVINLHDRIQRLEAAAFHGHPVVHLAVPAGYSPEQAWEEYKRGHQLTANRYRYVTVVTDNVGNLLRVFDG